MTGNPPDAAVEFLRAHAPAIPIVDQASDAPLPAALLEAVGRARIIGLGEPSHGDGTAFEFKAQLVRHLHRELGFDLLVWEGGLFDCLQVDEALKSGAAGPQALPFGVFGIWGRTSQVQDLYDHVAATQSGPKRIETAGFDVQVSGKGLAPAWMATIEDLGRRLPGQQAAIAVLRQVIDERHVQGIPVTLDLDDITAAAATVVDAIDANLDVGPGKPDSMIARCIHLLGPEAELSLLMKNGPQDAPAMEQYTLVRENNMGETLAWLCCEHFADRRIMVWGATSHLSQGMDDLELPDPFTGYPEQWRPTGTFLKAAAGDDYYLIDFLAGGGVAGAVHGAFTNTLAEPDEGSLEALCRAAGGDRFLDLRTLPTLPDGGWLAQPFVARPMGYVPLRGTWSTATDAFVYFETMYPGTMGPAPWPGVSAE